MRLNIGGILPFTTIDFPGHLAAVVFLQGCSWRCPYCHNSHLIDVHKQGDDWETLRNFLQSRRGLLDGVVFSGGEPLLQSGLSAAIAEIKKMGFKVALHTSGSSPQRLEQNLPQLDWVGLDIKTTYENYAQVTGVSGSGDKVQQSLEHLLASGVDYEVRTTVDPNVVTEEIVVELAETLAEAGVSHYVLQECRDVDEYIMKSSTIFDDGEVLNQLKQTLPDITLRRG